MKLIIDLGKQMVSPWSDSGLYVDVGVQLTLVIILGSGAAFLSHSAGTCE